MKAYIAESKKEIGLFGEHSHKKEILFKKFSSIFELLRGALIYDFKEFYEAKNILMRYDDRDNYINYGYWCDGQETRSPSASLVQYVVSKLELEEDDILLDVGSGLGQPDIDIIKTFPVKKIIGINVCSKQVEYANDRFRSLNLDNTIKHRVLHSDKIADELDTEGISCIVCIEAIEEISSIENFIRNAFNILPHNGRISFCGVVRIKSDNLSFLRMLLGTFFRKITTILYGDHYRMLDIYGELLEKHGFKNIHHERIGKYVYPCLYRYAKKRLPILKQNKNIPFILKVFAFLQLHGINFLFAWKQIEYVVYYANKKEE